jgi:hypothetical protein
MIMKALSLSGAALLLGALAPVFAQQNDNAPGTPASMVVTAEAKRGKTVPPLQPQDIQVSEKGDIRPVTELLPLGNDHAGLQLLLLIDDSARSSFGTEIPTLKQFVTSLPAGAEVGIGYMRNGMTQMVSNFTADHAAAAQKIRLAMGPGGADVSPYDSLSDAIKKWPQGKSRREVVMISSGIEGLGGGFTSDNPYVNAGITSAQKAGVVVYTIYSPSVGHFGHSFWRENWGQNFLAMLSDATGGESYYIGFGSPVSFQPYLNEIRQNLDHQYLLTFRAKPQNKAGLQPVKVKVKEKDADLAAPDKVWVRASL